MCASKHVYITLVQSLIVRHQKCTQRFECMRSCTPCTNWIHAHLGGSNATGAQECAPQMDQKLICQRECTTKLFSCTALIRVPKTCLGRVESFFAGKIKHAMGVFKSSCVHDDACHRYIQSFPACTHMPSRSAPKACSHVKRCMP